MLAGTDTVFIIWHTEVHRIVLYAIHEISLDNTSVTKRYEYMFIIFDSIEMGYNVFNMN